MTIFSIFECANTIPMHSIITERFRKCIHKLIAEKKVNSKRQFALALDYFPQGISEICNGRRDVTIELLRKAVERFQLNPSYLLDGKGPELLSNGHKPGFEVLTIVTDSEDKERIVHVPVPAQAGYAAGHYADPVFIGNLPTYNLPVMNLSSGTYRSFDVAGDSMQPTLRNGDKIICAYVESQFWSEAVKNNQLYTIVTQDNVIVKRCRNQIRTQRTIHCLSDNPDYEPYPLSISEIHEIWKVRLKITSHLEAGDQNQDLVVRLEAISDQLKKQYAELEQLRETILHSKSVT